MFPKTAIERLAKAEIVALTGMNVQRERMLEILMELKARGAFTVVHTMVQNMTVRQSRIVNTF